LRVRPTTKAATRAVCSLTVDFNFRFLTPVSLGLCPAYQVAVPFGDADRLVDSEAVVGSAVVGEHR
jgi:hypothetical protein